MNVSWSRLSRRLLGVLGGLAALAGLLAVALPTPADTPLFGGLVYRVEEDWLLTVNQVNSTLASPQVSTQMAKSTTTSRFFNFHLNSIDYPSFQLGGLQLQAWQGSTNTNVYTSPLTGTMSTDQETVQWTQYLRNDSGSVKFGIGTIQQGGAAGAVSTTWGDFSGIEVDAGGGSTILDNYDPQYSVSNSGVTYGANRVDTLTLMAVRRYLITGTVLTDSTPRVVYTASSQSGDN
jgi:hypothetical protein